MSYSARNLDHLEQNALDLPLVTLTPALDQHLRLSERREDLDVQEFIPELRVQAFAVAFLPWAAGLDVERLDPDPAKPLTRVSGDEFGSVAPRELTGSTKALSGCRASKLKQAVRAGPQISVNGAMKFPRMWAFNFP